LAKLYYEGWGVPRDEAQALEWYRRSAEAGYAPAQLNLGSLYLEGRILEQDQRTGLEWIRRAAEQGSDRAQAKLGISYLDGEGLGYDPVLAHMWLSLSEAKGTEDWRRTAERKLSSSQLEESRRLVRQWREARSAVQ
jgi:TPR repeat protein